MVAWASHHPAAALCAGTGLNGAGAGWLLAGARQSFIVRLGHGGRLPCPFHVRFVFTIVGEA